MVRKHKVRPWVRRRRILVAIFGFCVLLSALLEWVSWRTDTAIEKHIAAIRAQGYPATLDDLKKAYPPPPKERNAEETFGKNVRISSAMLPEDEETMLKETRKASGLNSISKDLRKKMDEFLAANADTLGRLHEAARTPPGRFPVDWQSPITDADLYLRSFRTRRAVGLLACEATVAAEDGDVPRALEAVLAALNLGNTLLDEPFSDSQEMRYKCHKMTCDVIQGMLGRGNLSETDLLQLADKLRSEDYPQGMTRALVAERARHLVMCNHPRDFFYLPEADQYFPGGSILLGWAARAMVVYGGDLSFYLSAMTELINASQNPTPQATLVGDHIQQELGRTRNVFSMMYLPKNPVRELACDQVCLRETMAAIAAERYRLANGRPAEGFSDLIPAFIESVPLDPFSGQPVQFRSEGGGWFLYSVGPDLVDGGGTGDDIVFREVQPS